MRLSRHFEVWRIAAFAVASPDEEEDQCKMRRLSASLSNMEKLHSDRELICPSPADQYFVTGAKQQRHFGGKKIRIRTKANGRTW
jgi:hypothetical protein